MNHVHASSWSPDGKWLALAVLDPATAEDILLLPTKGVGKPQVFLRTPFNERGAKFSPDGRWLADESDESGRPHVYVQSFQGPPGKWQISTEGGFEPLSSRDGKEMFYRDGDKVMAVAVQTGSSVTAAKPRLLFEGRYQRGVNHTSYDVSADGRRFILIKSSDDTAPQQIHVVLNWFEDLKKRSPKPRSP